MALDGDEALILTQWSERLAEALQILDLEVDQELLLNLARKSAAEVIHPAAPVTTFMVGYAAGLKAGATGGDSKVSSAVAVSEAASVAFRLCEGDTGGGSIGKGGAGTAR